MFRKKKNDPAQSEGTENSPQRKSVNDAQDTVAPHGHAFMRKTIKRCENCDSELESTRKSNLCEACEKEQLQKNVKKGAAAAAAIGLAKVVIPKVAPYAKKAAPLVANAVKKIVFR